MSVTIDCFDYIIGLSDTDCSDCYTIPADAGVSYSGLFLDKLINLRVYDAINNCEEGTDVFAIMDKARTDAILGFISDVEMRLKKKYKLKRRIFKGSIGRIKNNGARSLTAGYYAGARWSCADVVSGIAKITNIGTLFEQSGTITLWIYNNLGELVATEVLNTTAGAHRRNVVDIELPLHGNYVENMEYFFVYQVGANMPLDNDVSCNCKNTKFVFDTSAPYYYHTQTNKLHGWANWLMVGGYYQDNIDDLDDCSISTNNYINGLTWELELKCKVGEVLCEDYLDFDANPLALSMAHAVYYRAGVISIDKIQGSPNLNRPNLINTDQQNADKEEWEEKYKEIVEYIVDTIDVTTNDCLECKDVQDIFKAGLFK